MTVHPHARGDNCDSDVGSMLHRSVHPHARGDNDSASSATGRRLRFTPTRVGTTDRCGSTTRRFDGSPPRAWGQPRPSCRRLPGTLRFTPTRVGTTLTSTASRCRMTVHPHARGDNDADAASGATSTRFTPTRVGTTVRDAPRHAPRYGSPPRAWGQLRRSACGGCVRSVHPHARGDNVRCSLALAACRAVHPHARGDN